MSREGPSSDTSSGVLMLVGAALSFSVMALLVKVGGRMGLPALEMVLGRGVVTLALSYAALRLRKLSPWGHARGILLLRGLLGFVALSAFFFAVTRLPLTEVTVIHFLNPMIAALLAAVVLRERIGWIHAGGVTVSLAGVVLVTRPAAIFAVVAPLDALGIAAALAAATFSAAAYVAVRYLSRSEDPLVIVFYFSLVAVPAAAPFLWVSIWPHGMQWLVLLGIGIATQAGQVLLTRGLERVPAGPGTAIGYMQILFAAAWGLLFGEHPSAWTIGGALLVVAGVVLVVLGVRRSGPAA